MRAVAVESSTLDWRAPTSRLIHRSRRVRAGGQLEPASDAIAPAGPTSLDSRSAGVGIGWQSRHVPDKAGRLFASCWPWPKDLARAIPSDSTIVRPRTLSVRPGGPRLGQQQGNYAPVGSVRRTMPILGAAQRGPQQTMRSSVRLVPARVAAPRLWP